jgi:4-diphosphocytidyl-2-C-methyl-D-erythritol kinase
MLTLAAPAKINLHLHITGRRADGYHLLDTVFQLIDLCDTVRLAVRSDGQICLHTPIEGLDDRQHLAVMAAHCLNNHCQSSLGADIWVDKRIPSGAGLGGGSSDAATTLLGLNHLWGCGLSREALQTLGLQLGADVPFFCSQWGTARATGVGEQLQAIATPGKAYIVVFPDCHVPTPTVFKHPALDWQAEQTRRIAASQLTMQAAPSDISAASARFNQTPILAPILAPVGNDLQPVATLIAPPIAAALAWLDSAPAHEGVCMSGSGSAVFAQFSSLDMARSSLEAVNARRPSSAAAWSAWAVRGLAQHPFGFSA